MHLSCWIPTATNLHSECVILITFPLQQWLNERASIVMLNVHYHSWFLHCDVPSAGDVGSKQVS
jgi:hypothetical protein